MVSSKNPNNHPMRKKMQPRFPAAALHLLVLVIFDSPERQNLTGFATPIKPLPVPATIAKRINMHINAPNMRGLRRFLLESRLIIHFLRNENLKDVF
jgi:hypothetical protein